MRWFHVIPMLLASLSATPLSASDELATTTVERVAMPLEYQVDGVVEARRKATVSAEISGKVEAVNFDIDDRVEQGAVLLRIGDREYRAGVQRARAALAEAEANLQEAKLKYDRSANLLQQKLIAQSAYDAVSAGYKAAQARLESARASLEQAEQQLERTVIRAPYSGVVVERHIEPGESIMPGQPFLTGYAPGVLRVSANVPQSRIASLRSRREVRVVLRDGRSFDVERVIIHPFANPQNHSFPVRLDLAGPVEDLYPGMLVKVNLSIGDTARLLLPRTALVSRAEINAVYVRADDGRLSLRQVRPGKRFDDRVEILAGLSAGEAVALDPVRAGIELKRQARPAQ